MENVYVSIQLENYCLSLSNFQVETKKFKVEQDIIFQNRNFQFPPSQLSKILLQICVDRWIKKFVIDEAKPFTDKSERL